MKTNTKKQGFVLTAVMMLIVIASLVGGAFLISARGTNTALERWKEYDACLLAVQAGLEAVNYSMYSNMIASSYQTGNSPDMLAVLADQDFTVDVNVEDGFAVPPSLGGGGGAASVSAANAGSTITVNVKVESGPLDDYPTQNRSEVLLNSKAMATYGKATRAVRELVDYEYNSSGTLTPGGGDPDVFDYVFFIDNVGWFSGVNCDFNGNVGANLDVDLKYSSIRLQGDAYAGGECTSKKLYRSYSWGSKYGDQSFAGLYFGDKVRPMLYTDANRSNPDTYYPQGYADGVNFYEHQNEYELPFIGPLSDYEEYATAVGGTVSDASTTVNAVWGDDAGEDAGVAGTSVDDGCLVLIGTQANPIRLDGVVVAEKDIYIKGYFTGQGTLYAGRNINVLGDVIALDDPTWPHPDSHPVTTAESNKTKDFLGLCAKGNLVFGHYDEIVHNMIMAPFTQDHASDASDEELGYVTGHYGDGQPYFDGDYTQPDGDGTEVRTDGSVRHYYEPILGRADYEALGVEPWVGHFDCVLYANHLIAGDFDPNTILNGAFICRDEAVKRHGNLAMNWDARLGSQTLDGMAFYSGLPGNMLPPSLPFPSRTIQWAEIEPW